MNCKVKGAAFSECRRYRYSLHRVWNTSLGLLQFIGLNPSKADKETDDNTIKRITMITKNLGYGGFIMTNLYCFISTDPDQLDTKEPLDQSVVNMISLLQAREECCEIVFAWGNFKQAKSQAIKMMQLFPEALCLGKNLNGSPKHPLFLRATSQLIKF